MGVIEVSIIVPVYNTELYLKRCIDSILAQTFSNFELILVDDGSTDGSSNICKDYVEEDNRVKYYYQNNQGASMARNHGIDICNGSYITFIDSDDWVDVDYIETMMKAVGTADIVQVGNHVYTSDGLMNRGDQNNDSLEAKMDGYSLSKYLLEGKYQSGGVPWGKLFKTSLWQDIRFPNIHRFEDVAVLYKLYWKANSIINISSAKYCYRSERPGSIMHSPYSIEWLKILDIEEERIRFFHEKNQYDLYMLSKFELANQLIYNIKSMRKNLPKETKEILELKKRLVREFCSLLYDKGYCIKKNKLLLKIIRTILC